MGSTTRLSVTVLNYNYARFLPACLDSILTQTFPDFELIVIDDCSTDDSLQAIAPYRGDPRVSVVAHESNAGYVASLLEGSDERSSGEYITVISADDLVLRPDAFERQVALLGANREATFCFSGFERIFSGSGSREVHRSFDGDRVIAGEEMFRRTLLDNNVQVLHTGTIVRRDAYLRSGGYARDLRYAPDTDLWLRLSLDGPAAYVADALYGYRIHAAQMSGTESHRPQMTETLGVLDRACAAAEARGMKLGSLRRDGMRAYLFGAAMDEAFRGDRRAAFSRCRTALSLRPKDALLARDFRIILLRAALGERFYGMMRSTGRLVTSPLRR